jgi:hypothetical protein
MKRYAWLILIAGAGCSAHFESGKTECSDKQECPSGWSCSDDGTSRTHYCYENKALGCPDSATFYCSQTLTCWPKPAACATATNCGTTSSPKWLICSNPSYHPDCSGTTCLPNLGTDAGPVGGATGLGGTTSRTGAGGATGTGGMRDAGATGGVGGTGGMRDAGAAGGVGGTGGVRDAGATGGIATGGTRDAGATGGVRDAGPGGTIGVGGATGRGGTGGSTSGGSALCSGTPAPCTAWTVIGLCKSENGCSWDATTAKCSGTPMPCSSYTSATWCLNNGCKWAGTYTCNATTPTAYCTSNPPSSGATACTTCIVNSCCGQLTACNNDPNCLSTMSGTAWNAYLDCTVNCCGSASACNYW